MLLNAEPTPLDLRFSLFGIPIRVHPFFWLFSAVMGWNVDDLNETLLWIGCVFVSILVHELGHALTALYFGWPPEIVLYSFGGYASYFPGRGYTTGRRILILMAGPGAGFVLFGLVLALHWLLIQQGTLPADPRAFAWESGGGRFYLQIVFDELEFINLWWGLVNLLPVYPLDGGQISYETLSELRPRDGRNIALRISLVVAGAAALYFYSDQRTYAAILFALLAVESLQRLQAIRRF